MEDSLGRRRNEVGEELLSPLGREIKEASLQVSRSVRDLLVLSDSIDPYSLDTEPWHAKAAWLASSMLQVPDHVRHLRGIHYVLVVREMPKPDGAPYRNDLSDWAWLGKVAAAARWLGYVPFDRLEDERADAPVIFRPERKTPACFIARGLDLDGATPLPGAKLVDYVPRQPFALGIFGEKTSLDAEVRPMAQQFEADMYLGAGELSASHAHDLARRAAEDGRMLIVLILTDFDPSGYQMSVSIARKLRALKTCEFPDFEYRVIEGALTLDQVTRPDQRLPSTPLKDSEKRSDRWLAEFGREQTEIDALLALYPGEVARIVEEKLAPYFDSTLSVRAAQAERRWLRNAEASLQELPRRAEFERRWAAIEADLAALNADIEAACERVELPAFTAPAAVDSAPYSRSDGIIASSEWDFIDETENLRQRKSYGNGDAI
jgi:hypothetical protein